MDVQRRGQAVQVADQQSTDAWAIDHQQSHRVLPGGFQVLFVYGARNDCDGLDMATARGRRECITRIMENSISKEHNDLDTTSAVLEIFQRDSASIPSSSL